MRGKVSWKSATITMLLSLTAAHVQASAKSAAECEVEASTGTEGTAESRYLKCIGTADPTLAKYPGDAKKCNAAAGDRKGGERRAFVAECLSPPKRPPQYYVVDFGIDEVNSAGGVEPYLEVVNPHEGRTIKYVTITVTMFNAVGDVIASEIDGNSTATLRATGPFSKDDGPRRKAWNPVFYNSTATCLRIGTLRVEFMDGRVQTFTGQKLKDAVHPDSLYTCSFAEQKR